MHYQQLGLGAVLARAQPCDGAGPAVELPGFRHVVDAHKEGQAACEERVSELLMTEATVAAARAERQTRGAHAHEQSEQRNTNRRTKNPPPR